jgi:hypothetical protein
MAVSDIVEVFTMVVLPPLLPFDPPPPARPPAPPPPTVMVNVPVKSTLLFTYT